jgi:hypothetical protein
MMHATANVAATVELMVAAIPEMRLRELFVRLILDSLPPTPPPPPPAQDAAKSRRGRPPKATVAANGRRRRTMRRGSAKKIIYPKLQERRRRYEIKRRARHAAKATAATVDAGSNGTGKSQDPPPVTSQALWDHATRLEPCAPWRAVARELGTHIDVARRAFHTTSLPYGVRPMMVERFLTVRNTT